MVNNIQSGGHQGKLRNEEHMQFIYEAKLPLAGCRGCPVAAAVICGARIEYAATVLYALPYRMRVLHCYTQAHQGCVPFCPTS